MRADNSLAGVVSGLRDTGGQHAHAHRKCQQNQQIRFTANGGFSGHR
jgi:hypothetical protein